MADNINVTPGTGKTVATDDIGGVQFQRVKVTLGNDGVNEGDLSSTNPLPVSISSPSPLPSGAATAAKQDTGNASLASIDGKITVVNTGAVVIASSALPTGAATESTLSSLNSKVTTVNTSNVTISSSALPTGAATSANQTTEITALNSINSTLGSPMQNSGGSVTANIGTTGGLALDSSLSTINSTLGSPFQAGGSIGNTSFVANAGTNLNTSALNLESTQSAFKVANHSDLLTINSTLGSPFQAGGSIGNTTFASTQSGAWTTGRTWTLSSGTDSVSSVVSGTVAVTQSTSPWVVSGTVTANIGTTGGLALDSSLSTINSTLGSPAQEHITAGSPSSVRLSDGTSFYIGFKAGDSIGNTAFIANAGTNLNTSALNLEATQSAFKVANHSDLLSIASILGSPFQAGGSIGNTSFIATQSSGANLHVNVDNFPADADALAQGSTTSGQLGALIMGAVTTAAPSYTTAQTNPLSLDTSGNLRITGTVTSTPSGVQHVIIDSGTSTVNQGTSPWVVSGTVTANIGTTNGLALDTSVNGLLLTQGSTTSGEKGPLIQGAVTSASPSYTDGQTSPLSLTTAGKLRTDLSTIAGNTALTGNGVTGTGSLRVTIASDNTAFTVNAAQSGTWSVGSTLDKNFGTVGANTLRTASQIGNATGAADFGAGTTGAQTLRVVLPTDQTAIPVTQSGAWTVTANAGTNLNTSALALDTSVNGILVSQGSTTSGEKGPLIQGAVTTAAPSYTTGQTSPLSLTTGGALRVDNSANTQPVSGTVTTTHLDIAPATQNITVQDTASTTTAMANSQNYITGTPTANSAASFAIASVESVEVQVTGTWTGTLSSEISMDGGTTWFTRGVKQAGVGYVTSSFTANFAGGLNVSGMTNYRVRATAAMTGTATVKIVESLNASSITVSNPILLKDGTTQSITNTIKAASTAAVATDTAIVVTISPNTALPTGTNSIGTVTSKVTQTTFVTGAKSSISTSAVQITTTSTAVNEGVCVKADSANTGVVYVGLSNVTNGTTDATDGFQIKSGESITIEVDNPNKVYVIASAASQKVYWVGV